MISVFFKNFYYGSNSYYIALLKNLHCFGFMFALYIYILLGIKYLFYFFFTFWCNKFLMIVVL